MISNFKGLPESSQDKIRFRMAAQEGRWPLAIKLFHKYKEDIKYWLSDEEAVEIYLTLRLSETSVGGGLARRLMDKHHLDYTVERQKSLEEIYYKMHYERFDKNLPEAEWIRQNARDWVTNYETA